MVTLENCHNTYAYCISGTFVIDFPDLFDCFTPICSIFDKIVQGPDSFCHHCMLLEQMISKILGALKHENVENGPERPQRGPHIKKSTLPRKMKPISSYRKFHKDFKSAIRMGFGSNI